MRRIYCTDCGKPKGVNDMTDPKKLFGIIEDMTLGKQERRTVGELKQPVYCDLCNKELSVGTEAVAITSPVTIGNWEQEYLK